MRDASPLLFCFGYGYSAARLAHRLADRGWRVIGTRRRADADSRQFGRMAPLTGIDDIVGADAILSSIPPDEIGDPVLDLYGEQLARSRAWRGYLSTTGVYGDCQGAWVDETAPRRAVSERGSARIIAEDRWLGIGAHVFRLAGIYGPGRSQIDALRGGRAKRIVKPGQVFSRIHVDDIALIIDASIGRPRPGAVYNVADDEPAAPQDVVLEAARILGVEPPPEVPFDLARSSLSPMALSFYADNKRVSNRLIKTEFGLTLTLPTYREGLRACLREEGIAGHHARQD